MANTLTNGVYLIDTAGVLKENANTDPALGVVRTSTSPIHIKTFVYTGTGTVTIKDNQTSPATLLTLTVSGGSVSVPINTTFLNGLQVTTITGGTLYVFLG